MDILFFFQGNVPQTPLDPWIISLKGLEEGVSLLPTTCVFMSLCCVKTHLVD